MTNYNEKDNHFEENQDDKSYQDNKKNISFVRQSLKYGLIVIFLCIVTYFGYEEYKIYNFQKRYKEAPAGSLIKTGNMNLKRSEHVNIPLKDGTILVVGGNKGAEIFNPKTGQYKLIDRELENISFAFNNYYMLSSGDVLIANKYLFKPSLKKFFKIKNYDNFYENQILNGNAIIFNNIFFYKDNLIFSSSNFEKTNHSNISCYDLNNNSIKSCEVSEEIEKYFNPLNYFSVIENYYLILKGKYEHLNNNLIENFYFGRADIKTNLFILKKNGEFYNLNCPSEIPLYNSNNILHDKNNLFFVDKNSNLFAYNIEKNTWVEKIQIPNFCNQTKMFFYKGNILIVSPILQGEKAIHISIYDMKENKIVNTLKFKYDTCSRSPHFIKSYDTIILQDALLINGGQFGIPKNTTAIKDSYIIKL